MPLRGKKPTTVDKRLKALFYGEAGVGKTTAAIQFPNPYLIDTEKGAEQNQYTKLLEKNQGMIFQSTDFDEILEEVKTLLVEKHPFKTLIIDPVTTIYHSLLEEAEKKVGDQYGKHYGEANKKFKKLLNLVLRLDMNVIFTSHAKNEYGNGMQVIGKIPDGYKKLSYLFDLEINIQKEGRKRIGVVTKSRIDTLDELSRFEFSYDEIAKRYGKGLIEKEVIQEKLSSKDQINKLMHLFEILNIPSNVIEKGLSKANANTVEDMPANLTQKWIEALESKINLKETN